MLFGNASVCSGDAMSTKAEFIVQKMNSVLVSGTEVRSWLQLQSTPEKAGGKWPHEGPPWRACHSLPVLVDDRMRFVWRYISGRSGVLVCQENIYNHLYNKRFYFPSKQIYDFVIIFPLMHAGWRGRRVAKERVDGSFIKTVLVVGQVVADDDLPTCS